MILTINKKSFDKNGNAIYNIYLESNMKNNATGDLLEKFRKNKLLKNGTLNIKQYKNIMIENVKSCFSTTLIIDIVEKY